MVRENKSFRNKDLFHSSSGSGVMRIVKFNEAFTLPLAPPYLPNHLHTDIDTKRLSVPTPHARYH